MKRHLLLIVSLYLFITTYSHLHAQVLIRQTENTNVVDSIAKHFQAVKTQLAPLMVDVDLKKELSEIDTSKAPYRFGKKVETNIKISQGSTFKIGEENIWSLRLNVLQGYSLSLKLSDFNLAEGAELYMFNDERDMIIGPITSKQNNKYNTYSTIPIKGRTINLYLKEPMGIENEIKSKFSIASVTVGYVNMFKTNTSNQKQPENTTTNSSQCKYDVACYPQYDASPVAIMFSNFGTQCTGTLVNNELQNGRAFFLTAFHCLDADGNGALSPTEMSGVNDYTFQFYYKNEYCNGTTTSTNVSFSGAEFRSAWETSDFALIEFSIRLILKPVLTFLVGTG